MKQYSRWKRTSLTPPDRSARRGGYALIEMMAVIFIIVIMLSILLPVVQNSREAARRVQCFNNLKQLLLATSLYETQNRVLPPGVVNPSGPIDDQRYDHHLGFISQLLPYLEQNYAYKVICQEASIYDATNTTVRRLRLSMLLCPDEPLVKPRGMMYLGLSAARASGPATTGQLGLSSYAACHHDVESPIDADNHGVFFLNSHVGVEDISDGTSNTIFFGEKLIPPLDLGWMSGTRATLRKHGHSDQQDGRGDGPKVGPVCRRFREPASGWVELRVRRRLGPVRERDHRPDCLPAPRQSLRRRACRWRFVLILSLLRGQRPCSAFVVRGKGRL